MYDPPPSLRQEACRATDWRGLTVFVLDLDVLVARGSVPQEAAVVAETGPVVKLHLVGASVRVRLLDLSEVSPPPGVQVLDYNLVAGCKSSRARAF